MTDELTTIDDMILACLPRTRAIDEAAFWGKYERLCNKHKVLPLVGPVQIALRRLRKEGKIVIKDQKARRV
jgi:hypothetical protein